MRNGMMGAYDDPDITDVVGAPATMPPDMNIQPGAEPALPNMDPMMGSSAPAPPPGPATILQDVDTLPSDAVGDIPPPPVPPPPASPPTVPGITGAPGTPTFARPGTKGARPFRTPSFGSGNQQLRFGPGVPTAGGSAGPAGDEGLGSPDEVGELLRQLAAGNVSSFGG